MEAVLAIAPIIRHGITDQKKWQGKAGKKLAKMGRPPKESSVLSQDIKVRVDDALHNDLLRYCDKTQKGKAEVIREAIRHFLDCQGG